MRRVRRDRKIAALQNVRSIGLQRCAGYGGSGVGEQTTSKADAGSDERLRKQKAPIGASKNVVAILFRIHVHCPR
jgi:hypothetical protein